MTTADIITHAQAFVQRHYAAVLDGLDLLLPATLLDDHLVAVWIGSGFMVRVAVAADGTAQLAPKRNKETNQ